jgi:hypothetical protein
MIIIVIATSAVNPGKASSNKAMFNMFLAVVMA